MERQKMPVRFADLRRLAETVPAYLAQKVGVRATPPLRAEVEYELAIVGLDTELLLLEFAEDYGVDIAAFDFTGLLLPDGPDLLDTLLFFPVLAYLLVGGLFKGVGTLLSWPFSADLAQRIWQQRIPAFWQPTP